MAGKVLTTGSTVKCLHGGAIAFTSSATLHVGGQPVVRASDVLQATITCPANTKCVRMKPPLPASASAVLHDAGSPVVLATALETDLGVCTIEAVGHELLETD
jgi:hypothetical protein